MSWRAFLLLAFLCIALLVAVIWINSHKRSPFLLELGDLSEITLSVSGQTIVLKKKENWQLDPPQNIPVDQESVTALIATAGQLETRRILTVSEKERETFQITTANSITFTSDFGVFCINTGRDTFDHADVYATIEKNGKKNNKIFLLSKERINQILKPLSELRYPYLFAVSLPELDKIVIQSDTPTTLVRHGLFWILEQKKLAIVSQSALDRFVSALGSLSVRHYIQDRTLLNTHQGTDVFFYGTVVRHMKFFSVSDHLFGWIDAYPDEIFEIPSEFLSYITASNWESTQPFQMDRFSLDEVILEGRASRRFLKQSTGAWHNEAGKNATIWLHNFLVYWSNIKQTHRPNRYTLQPETVHVVVFREGNLQSRLELRTHSEWKIAENPVAQVSFMGREMWVSNVTALLAHLAQ